MDARFGAQDAVGVLPGHLEGRALEACNFSGRFFEHFDREALAFAIAQVHAFEHQGPILCFGATGSCLNIQEAVVRVHRVGEHAAEFEAFHRGAYAREIGLHGDERVVVVFALGEFEQFGGVAQRRADALQRADRVVEGLAFFAEILCALLILPDRGILAQCADFLQALALGIEVKDTS